MSVRVCETGMWWWVGWDSGLRCPIVSPFLTCTPVGGRACGVPVACNFWCLGEGRGLIDTLWLTRLHTWVGGRAGQAEARQHRRAGAGSGEREGGGMSHR
eukprot:96320-Chlamydomonas_euryale.AAC.2